jgi:hypothetical protein
MVAREGRAPYPPGFWFVARGGWLLEREEHRTPGFWFVARGMTAREGRAPYPPGFWFVARGDGC